MRIVVTGKRVGMVAIALCLIGVALGWMYRCSMNNAYEAGRRAGVEESIAPCAANGLCLAITRISEQLPAQLE